MSITIEAVYEAGILKPLAPLTSLKDNTRVRVTIEPEAKPLPRVRLTNTAAPDYSQEHAVVGRMAFSFICKSAS